MPTACPAPALRSPALSRGSAGPGAAAALSARLRLHAAPAGRAAAKRSFALAAAIALLLGLLSTSTAIAQSQQAPPATAPDTGVGGVTIAPPSSSSEIIPQHEPGALTPDLRGDWRHIFGSLPVQIEGRTMPMDSWANRVAVKLTGRSRWSAERGPEAFAGRHRVELLADLLFQPQRLVDAELIEIQNRPFKRLVGLDEDRRFFAPSELVRSTGINNVVVGFRQVRETNPKARPDKMQQIALSIQEQLHLIDGFMIGEPIAMVPPAAHADGSPLNASELHTFRSVSVNPMRLTAAELQNPDVARVQAALLRFQQSYLMGTNLDDSATKLAQAVYTSGVLDANTARDVRLEVFYNDHRPWIRTAIAYGLAIAAAGLSLLIFPRVLMTAAALLAAWGVGEQLLGLYLRIEILGRAPVSNTYEALLWMGLVALAFGVIAQMVAMKRSQYFLAGLMAAELSVLFAMLVPLEDQTNAIPAVLRSNYWLIVHVLTIVASYAVLTVAAMLGHLYLFKEVIFNRTGRPAPKLGNPLITQMYRCIQVGLLLLTAGTILGGVWAADSWGRFWGWDPKETWALISMVAYFALLHARFVGWLHDFGFAVGSVVGIGLIGWTFYGVNYVMAAGLHSYGFGSGGEFWYFVWVAGSIVFLVGCKFRQMSLENRAFRMDQANLRATGSENAAATANANSASGHPARAGGRLAGAAGPGTTGAGPELADHTAAGPERG